MILKAGDGAPMQGMKVLPAEQQGKLNEMKMHFLYHGVQVSLICKFSK